MNTLMPELFFRNLPEIEALPFDLGINISSTEEPENLCAIDPAVTPQHAAIIQRAMNKTSNSFGVSLQVWRAERRRAG